MKRIAKILAFVLILQAVALVFARLAESRAHQDTDPQSEDFALAAYFNGKQYVSTAGKLHTGSAITVFGGMDLNLTGAELDPACASLRLKTRFGGVKVVVPDTWRVEMTGGATAGENELRAADPGTLPEDAPRLSIVADTKFGGVLITT